MSITLRTIREFYNEANKLKHHDIRHLAEEYNIKRNIAYDVLEVGRFYYNRDVAQDKLCYHCEEAGLSDMYHRDCNNNVICQDCADNQIEEQEENKYHNEMRHWGKL